MPQLVVITVWHAGQDIVDSHRVQYTGTVRFVASTWNDAVVGKEAVQAFTAEGVPRGTEALPQHP